MRMYTTVWPLLRLDYLCQRHGSRTKSRIHRSAVPRGWSPGMPAFLSLFRPRRCRRASYKFNEFSFEFRCLRLSCPLPYSESLYLEVQAVNVEPFQDKNLIVLLPIPLSVNSKNGNLQPPQSSKSMPSPHRTQDLRVLDFLLYKRGKKAYTPSLFSARGQMQIDLVGFLQYLGIQT